MKQKIITIIVTVMTILGAILIMPTKFYNDSYILKVWTLLMGGALLLFLIFLNYKELKLDSKDYLVLIFLFLVFLSTLFSIHIKTSIWGRRTRYEGLLMFATYVCLYLCAKKFYYFKNKNVLLNILFVFCMFIGILGILQRYLEYLKLYPIFNRGVCATFGNNNFFGSFITIVLPISICSFIFYRSKRAFIISLVMFFNLISCATRSAWLAFVLGTLLFIVILIKEKNKKFYLRSFILLICFAIISTYLFTNFDFIKAKFKTENQQTNTTTNTTSKNKTKKPQIPEAQKRIEDTKKEITKAQETNSIDRMASGRIEIWKMTLKLISKKPLFGCGTDNLWIGLTAYCNQEIVAYSQRTKTDIDKAHNEFLHIAATNGIPALIVYMVFLGLIIFPKMKTMFKDKITFILITTIICYLAQAFFNISTIGVAPFFWILLGIVDNKEFLNKFALEE